MLLQNKKLFLGLSIISIYVFAALGWFFFIYFFNGSIDNPYIIPISLEKELLPPWGSGYFLGTDLYGRSLLHTMLQGTFYTLLFAISVSLACGFIGLCVGYLSAKTGNFIEKFLAYSTNIIFIIPTLLTAIFFASLVNGSHLGIFLALTIGGWASYARIVQVETRRILAQSYIEAAISIGANQRRIFFYYLIPEIFPQMIVHTTLSFGTVILSEATLGFLGLSSSEYSWGKLFYMAKDVLLEAPHVIFVLTFFFTLLIIGFNLLGEGLKKHFYPLGCYE